MRTIRKTGIRGFTLIELLVVMAVMSILIGIGVNTFSIAQKKARDAKRKADLRTIQIAVEAYAINNNGAYPSSGAAPEVWLMSDAGNSWITVLVPNYLAKVPIDSYGPNGDPLANTPVVGYKYKYEPTGTNGTSGGYMLVAHLEDAEDSAVCKKITPIKHPANGNTTFCGSATDYTASPGYASSYWVVGYK